MYNSFKFISIMFAIYFASVIIKLACYFLVKLSFKLTLSINFV